MDIKTQLIPISTYKNSQYARRRGIKLEYVGFFVDHDTGNSNSTAKGNVNYFIHTYNEASASAHIFIDDVEAIMCIPCFEDAERAHHVLYNIEEDNENYGGDSNDIAIGLELCYFPEDIERTWKAYYNYIDVASDLCLFHGVDPKHREGHFELDPDRKTDPYNALNVIGLTYEDMKDDILKGCYKKMSKTWEEILEEVLDQPEDWIKAIGILKEMAEMSSNLGDLEIVKYIDSLIIKVYNK